MLHTGYFVKYNESENEKLALQKDLHSLGEKIFLMRPDFSLLFYNLIAFFWNT